ncbi:MAG: type I restriction enzyme HsdR N-terminal domain-containing protein [Microscillaceae bacterium]|nr:type I restriction enzyme HsdR N-terminal domain-containing protein [Microscillaceae bacterium]MDW8460802.1 type I restriction enzyme HsdR N-terminal domain-containing protein [Cytophagales bacterium]
MLTLNLSHYTPKTRRLAHKVEIWDMVRKKFVTLTPEEMIRQAMIQYLVAEKSYPPALMSTEQHLQYAQRTKRADIVAYSPEGKVLLLVECKAPYVALSQQAIEQICNYNFALQARYVALYNGCELYALEMIYKTHTFQEVLEIPNYHSFA